MTNIFEKLFMWNLPPQGDILDAEVIIVHAAGQSFSIDGGAVNMNLAFVVRNILSKKKMAVIAQGEVADVLKSLGITVLARSDSQLERKLNGKVYLSTKDISLWHQEICIKHKYKRVILISHQGHLPRAYLVTQKLCPYFTEIIIPQVPSRIYDRHNSQWRWRSSLTAWPYETTIRLAYLLRRYM